MKKFLLSKKGMLLQWTLVLILGHYLEYYLLRPFMFSPPIVKEREMRSSTLTIVEDGVKVTVFGGFRVFDHYSFVLKGATLTRGTETLKPSSK